MIQTIVHQQLVLLMHTQNKSYVQARQSFLLLEETKQRQSDEQRDRNKLERLWFYDLWRNRLLLSAVLAIACILGAIAGHNLLSRAVLCDSPLCVNSRLDGRVQEMR